MDPIDVNKPQKEPAGSNIPAAPRFKLVEYDESDSSNDSHDSKDNKTSVPPIEDIATSGSNLTDVKLIASDNDSEKSQDGYSSKEFSAQDIDLIIMGGSQQEDLGKVEIQEPSSNLEPQVRLENDTENLVTDDILNKITEIDNITESNVDILSDIVETDNLESIENVELNQVISSDLISNDVDALVNTLEDEIVQSTSDVLDSTIDTLVEVNYDTSVRSIEDMESDLIQITEIDFAKLPLDDSMPGSSQESLLTESINLEETKTAQKVVMDTDDELEFFDCETDFIEGSKLVTINEENNSKEILTNEKQEEIILSDIQNPAADDELSVKNVISENKHLDSVEGNVIDNISKTDLDEILKDDETTIENKSEENSESETIGNTCDSMETDNVGLINSEISQEVNIETEILKNPQSEIADETVSSTMTHNLENTTETQNEIVQSMDTESDERKVQPLKLNLSNVDLSSAKSKLKRPLSKLSPDSSGVVQKIPKKSHEHEPIPKLTLRKVDMEIGEQMDTVIDDSSPMKLNIKAIKKPVDTPKVTIKPIPEEFQSETVPRLILKVDQDQETTQDIVPKLIIKKQDTEMVPKLTLKIPPDSNTKDSTSESETEEFRINENETIPKVTIKPIAKQETEMVPKLTLKIPSNIDESTIIPKVTIKPIVKPDSETLPKITLKLTEDSIIKDDGPKVPKLTLKLPSEISSIDQGGHSKETSESECDEESQIVPKLTLKIPQEIQDTDVTSEVETHQTIPKLTIKPIVKPESEIVPKLTVKLSSTGEHHIENTTDETIPKLTIKTKINEEIPKLTIVRQETQSSPLKTESKTQQRLTIKPLCKLTEPETVPKLTLKLPSDLTIDTLEHHNKDVNQTSVPKFTIKPIPSPISIDHNQPLEIITTDKSSESGQESPRIIIKINKTKSEILSPSTDKNPIDKIKLKLSKTGQHPHIIHEALQEDDPNTICMKRALMNPNLDVIEIKRSKPDLQYNRLPDVSIERVNQSSPKQTEKQRSEKRLKDILSRLHKKSNEPSQKIVTENTLQHDLDNDNSSSSGDCVIIEEDQPKFINFGRDIELINISPRVNVGRGGYPRKRGRPKKEIAMLTKGVLEDQSSLGSQASQGDQIITEGVLGRSRRILRGRSPIVRGTPRGTRRGSGQTRRGGSLTQHQQQQITSMFSPGSNIQGGPSDLKSPTGVSDTKADSTDINKDVISINSDSPLKNLQALTSSIDLTGQDDSQEGFTTTTPQKVEQTESAFSQITLGAPSEEGHTPPAPMKTPQSTRARSRRARGSRSKANARQRNKNVKESPLPMFEEDTRMSADLGNKMAPATPSKPTEGNEESQSSVLSSANENSKNKRGRMEVGDCDGKVEFTVDQIAEYQWPQPLSPSHSHTQSLSHSHAHSSELPESYMIQEQIALYLGVTSFKRKYPDVKRRQLDMQERDYVMGRQLVTETLCDLGLTAIPTCEVLDIMSADFPQKYDEYKKYLRDKQAKELALRTKAFNSDRNKQRSIKDRAISSASSWNCNLNKERLENRRGCIDLQTYVIQKPKKPLGVSNNNNNNKIGNYPVALVPGQYCDYYKHYSPNELRYFPLDTVLYGPQKPNQRFDDDEQHIDRNDTQSESSDTSDSSSESDTDTSSDDSVNEEPMASSEPVCKLCRLGKPGQELIQCSSCRAQLHATCTGLSISSLVVSRCYAWRCQDCKMCSKCGGRALGAPRMLRCEKCDRAIHSSCVVGAGLGSQSIPISTRWSCPGQCGSCDSCGVSGGPRGGQGGGGEGGAQWRHVRTPVGMRQLCHPCAIMWQDKRYCTICYRCVIESQQLLACKFCGHKLHADCVRRQYSNSNIDSVTCIECSKRAVVRVSNTSHQSEVSTRSTPMKTSELKLGNPMKLELKMTEGVMNC